MNDRWEIKGHLYMNNKRRLIMMDNENAEEIVRKEAQFEILLISELQRNRIGKVWLNIDINFRDIYHNVVK